MRQGIELLAEMNMDLMEDLELDGRKMPQEIHDFWVQTAETTEALQRNLLYNKIMANPLTGKQAEIIAEHLENEDMRPAILAKLLRDYQRMNDCVKVVYRWERTITGHEIEA